MKPNILLITLDAVRPDRLRLYGGPVEMPNLESLAARGVAFTNAWAQAPNTWTSHASIFTGLWPHHHGLIDMDCELPKEIPTLGDFQRGRICDGRMAGLRRGRIQIRALPWVSIFRRGLSFRPRRMGVRIR